MKKFLVNELPRAKKNISLDSTESHHATKVLRLKPGTSVQAIDGEGNSCIAQIVRRGNRVELTFQKDLVTEKIQTAPITLEASVLKSESMGWLIEKAVELGIEKIQPIFTRFTVVKQKRKSFEDFQNKWQKMADQALKQCGRLQRLKVSVPMNVVEIPEVSQNEIRFFLDEQARGEENLLQAFLNTDRKEISQVKILVGPEGGWEDEERAYLRSLKCQTVRLGPHVLRSETAMVTAIGLIANVYWLDKSLCPTETE